MDLQHKKRTFIVPSLYALFALIFIAAATLHYGFSACATLLIYFLLLALPFLGMRFFDEPLLDRFPFARCAAAGFVLALVSAFALEVLTLYGARLQTPFEISDWSVSRLLLFFLLVFIVWVYCFYFWFTRKNSQNAASLADTLKTFAKTCLLPLVIGVAAAVLVSKPLGAATGYTEMALGSILFAPFSLAACIVINKGHNALHPERLVFVAIITIGLGIIVCMPVTNLLSWDDEVHYRNAQELSYLASPEKSDSDAMITTLFNIEEGFDEDARLDKSNPIDMTITWDDEDVTDLAEDLDSADETTLEETSEGLSTYSITYSYLGYLPSSFGLWLGRFFRLSFTARFMLGRVCNLIFYAFVCYKAIKLIPTKKILMSVIALWPTTVFMAANYSYDPWITCLSLLYFALLTRAIVSDKKLSAPLVVGLIAALTIGLAPKAIYFPLFGLVLLIPKEKYPTKAARRALISIALVAFFFIIITFLVPYISSNGGGSGDSRGGSSVNASAQTALVLAQPVFFIKTMTRFVFGTLLTSYYVSYSATFMAYLGDFGSYSTVLAYLPFVLLLVLGVLDADDFSAKIVKLGRLVWTAFLVISILYLISAALYISFTSVGSDSVAGVQARYLIPLYAPVMLYVINLKWVPPFNKKIFNGCAVAAMLAFTYSETLILLFLRCL